MKKKLSALLSNPFLQGSFILTSGSFVISFFNYLFNLFAGRILGPQGYGEITALFSYTIILSIPFTIFSNLVIQKIGEKESNQYGFVKMFNDWFFTKLKKILPFFLIIIFVVPFIPRLTNLSVAASYSFFPLILFSIFSVFYTATLQALHFFLAFISISIFAVFMKLTGIIFVYFGVGDVSMVIIFLVLSSLFIWISSYLIVKKKVLDKASPAVKLEKRLLSLFTDRQIVIMTLSILGITIFNNLDIIFVKKFFSAQDSGLYSAWSLFAKIIFYLVGPLISVAYIFFNSINKKYNQKNILFLSSAAVAAIGFLAWLAYSLYPKTVINIFFGNKFYSISPALGLAAFFGIFYAFAALMNNYFLAKKSLAALILILFLPFYIICLFLYRQNVQNIMKVNVFFSLIIILVYFVTYLFLNKKKILL